RADPDRKSRPPPGAGSGWGGSETSGEEDAHPQQTASVAWSETVISFAYEAPPSPPAAPSSGLAGEGGSRFPPAPRSAAEKVRRKSVARSGLKHRGSGRSFRSCAP